MENEINQYVDDNFKNLDEKRPAIKNKNRSNANKIDSLINDLGITDIKQKNKLRVELHKYLSDENSCFKANINDINDENGNMITDVSDDINNIIEIVIGQNNDNVRINEFCQRITDSNANFLNEHINNHNYNFGNIDEK